MPPLAISQALVPDIASVNRRQPSTDGASTLSPSAASPFLIVSGSAATPTEIVTPSVLDAEDFSTLTAAWSSFSPASRTVASMVTMSIAYPTRTPLVDLSTQGSSDDSPISTNAYIGIGVCVGIAILSCRIAVAVNRRRVAARVRAAPRARTRVRVANPAPSMTGLTPYMSQQSISTLFKECTICLSRLADDKFPKRPPTHGCTHSSLVCTVCLKTYVDGRVQSYGTAAPACPTPECGQTLAYEDVREFASPEAFHRYDHLLMRKALEHEPSFVWCKNPTCESGQYHTGEGVTNVVTCISCGSKSCFHHAIPWHENMTCAEYDKANRSRNGAAEAAAKKFIEERTKRCPKCNAPIEKIAGCDHMTCRPPGGCGHEFCWSCLANYREIVREGNHRHHRHCRFYARPAG